MALTKHPFTAESPLAKPAMYCNLDQLLDGCLKMRLKGASPPVALLIEGFPRPHHPIAEFVKLLFLLRAHGAKATFVVDWYDIRERGLCASVSQMMLLLTRNGHEVAVKFKALPCTATQLRQQAVEALHFLQRVYGISVVSAKVGCRMNGASAALETLGITIVNGVKEQRVVNDSADMITEVETILEALRGRAFVGVSRL